MVHTEGGHRLVAHARVDRNGERQENTGRKSYRFKLKIPFINTIARGKNETWENLFPGTYRKMIAALEDRSTGPFTHPIYGSVTCKADSWSEDIDPDFRGGPVLMVEFAETADDADSAGVASMSALSIAETAALSLDAIFIPLRPPIDLGTPPGMSLADFVRKIGAIADRIDLMRQQWEAKVFRVIYALETTKGKYENAFGVADNIDRLVSALHELRRQTLVLVRPTSIYVVPRATTAAALAQRLLNPVAVLFALNSTLAASPIVPAETAIRYYVP